MRIRTLGHPVPRTRRLIDTAVVIVRPFKVRAWSILDMAASPAVTGVFNRRGGVYLKVLDRD